MKRIPTILLSVLAASLAALLLGAGPASAQAKTRTYTVPKLTGLTLKQAEKKLKADHFKVGKVTDPKDSKGKTLIVSVQAPKAKKREKKGTKVNLRFKVKPVSVTTLIAPAVTLHVSLDPSLTQNPSNPLQVTYQVSASATTDTDGTTQTISDLPDGVLEFFSDGSLADTMNVGGTVTGGSVTVTYAAYGSHTTNVVYDSGTNSTTTGNVAEEILPPPPIIFGVPANIVTAATSASGAVVTFTTPTTSNLFDDAVSSPTCSTRSGATVAIGTVIDTCTATDQWGQTSRASFQITVNPPTTPPAFSNVPADISVPPADPSGTVVTFTPPTATDVFGDPVTVSCSVPSGTLVAIGTVTDTCTATDEWGNTSTAPFAITVQSPAPETLAFTSFDTSVLGLNSCPVIDGGGCTGASPPEPLVIPMSAGDGPNDTDGSGLDLWIVATGGYTSDPYPAGTITFTITPSSPWEELGIGSGSTDCSAVNNASPYVMGVGCEMYFDQDGTYTIATSFTSDDPLYDSIAYGPTLTVDVTGS